MCQQLSACQAPCTTWGCVHLGEEGHLPLPKVLSAPGATHTPGLSLPTGGPPPHRQVGALLPTLYLLSLSLCFVWLLTFCPSRRALASAGIASSAPSAEPGTRVNLHRRKESALPPLPSAPWQMLGPCRLPLAPRSDELTQEAKEKEAGGFRRSEYGGEFTRGQAAAGRA